MIVVFTQRYLVYYSLISDRQFKIILKRKLIPLVTHYHVHTKWKKWFYD